MKKLLIASAVSAAFAAPTLALAQAARAPTLSQVLDASGLNVSGYIDAGYSYANRNIEATPQFRVLDSQNNSFALHQFGLQVAKQPTRGFGGVVNNGWDQLTDANKGKTLELGASIIPIKPLTINVTGYFGQESAGLQRQLLNVVATYTINNRMSAGGEILYVSQDRAVGGAAKYNGLAGYFTYNLNREWRVAARAEMFDDKNGFHFAPAAPFTASDTKYNEVTATLAYLPSSSVELRGEVRGDRSDKAVFINSNGTTAKTLQTFGLQGIYKF